MLVIVGTIFTAIALVAFGYAALEKIGNNVSWKAVDWSAVIVFVFAGLLASIVSVVAFMAYFK